MTIVIISILITYVIGNIYAYKLTRLTNSYKYESIRKQECRDMMIFMTVVITVVLCLVALREQAIYAQSILLE